MLFNWGETLEAPGGQVSATLQWPSAVLIPISDFQCEPVFCTRRLCSSAQLQVFFLSPQSDHLAHNSASPINCHNISLWLGEKNRNSSSKVDCVVWWTTCRPHVYRCVCVCAHACMPVCKFSVNERSTLATPETGLILWAVIILLYSPRAFFSESIPAFRQKKKKVFSMDWVSRHHLQHHLNNNGHRCRRCRVFIM